MTLSTNASGGQNSEKTAEIEIQTSKRQGFNKYLHVFTTATLALILPAIRINKKQEQSLALTVDTKRMQEASELRSSGDIIPVVLRSVWISACLSGFLIATVRWICWHHDILGEQRDFLLPFLFPSSIFRRLLPGFSDTLKRLDTEMPMTISPESSITAWLPACLCAS
jgi:hypothetical protein